MPTKESTKKTTTTKATSVAKEKEKITKKAETSSVAKSAKASKEKAETSSAVKPAKASKEKAEIPSVAKTTKTTKDKVEKKAIATTTTSTKAKTSPASSKDAIKEEKAIAKKLSNTKASTKQSKVDKAEKTVTTPTATSSSKVVRVTVSTTENPAASKLAKKLNLPFNIGDYVFYPNEGVGHIIGTEDIVLEEELTPYYVIRFSSQKMTNRIPIENFKKVKLRKIIGKSVANNVLKVFEQEPPKSDLSWKDRLLVYQKINSKGNSIEMAEMLTALFFRKQARNNLSFQERQVFDFTLEAISSEIAVVFGITNKEANMEISKRLATTYQNVFELEEEE